jgi:WD40 repeat protein
VNRFRLQVPLPKALFGVLFVGLLALSFACNDSDSTVDLLFSAQGNQLDVYDLETDWMLLLVPSARDGGEDLNGQACLLPDGSGNFLMGHDTNQSEGDRQGWGIFTPEGEFVSKILEPETPNEPEQPEPFGCAFDQDERLFVTDVGSGSFDATDGKLIVFFPPEYDTFCILESELRVPGTIAIDDDGTVYMPETVPPGKVLRYSGPFPETEDECASVVPTKDTFIEDSEVQTPFGIVRAPNGNWYVSSVYLPKAIREYDANGDFVQTIVEGDDIGSPAGMAVASDGTLYYADLAIVQEEPGSLPGPAGGQGTVRKVTFSEDGTPSAPEIIGSGFDYPDAVSILEQPD